MKNKILILLLSASAIVMAPSCKKTTEGLTDITYYPEMTLLGNNPAVILTGSTFNDPGIEAVMEGEDVTDQVTVSDGVDYDTPGAYSITYTVVNADGFASSISRTVYVVAENSVANFYFGESAAGARHYTGAPIYVTSNGDGTYHLDDLMGGFQFYGLNPGFEPPYDFHAEVDFSIEDASGAITLTSQVGSWYFGDTGDVVLGLTSGTYDSATGIISLNVDYGGTPMSVTLTVPDVTE